MSEFRNKMMYLLTWYRTWYLQQNLRQRKLYWNFQIFISKNNIVVLIKSVFSVDSLTPSIINTKYTMFMHTHCTYSTNNPSYLNIFPTDSTIRGSQFLFTNTIYFFEERFVGFYFFTCYFCLLDGFFCFGLIWSL